MSDTEIKRQVLGSLMNLMDEHTRSGMKDSFMTEKKETPAAPSVPKAAKSSVETQKEDVAEPESIDPVVLLAKRLGR